MPDLAPWLPLLAIPFDAEVPSTPEADALDPAASRDRLQSTVETFLERVLMMPTLHRRRGRALARRLVPSPPPLPRGQAAPRPWLVCVTTRPSADSLVGRGGPGERLELAPLDVDRATELALAVAAEHALSAEAVEDIAFRAGGQPALRP